MRMPAALNCDVLTAARCPADFGSLTVSPGLVGVLGGMGPLATVDFMQKMLDATPARCDQEHVPALVSSIPQIPDRTRAFQGAGDSPLPALLECADRLRAGGASLIVIPCNTAHLWFDEVQAHVGIPMLHIVDAALEEAAGSGRNGRFGLLATPATTASGLYTRREAPALGGQSDEWVLPTDLEMSEWVAPGIAAVKAGRVKEGEALLQLAAQALHNRGACSIVLGCTEIPLVLDERNTPVPTIDATAALARRAVRWSQRVRAATTQIPATARSQLASVSA